jgi:uncharacterized membrane protein
MPYRNSPSPPPLFALLSLIPFISALTAYYAVRDALLATYLVVGMTAFLVLAKIPEESEDIVYLLAISCVSLSLFLVTELASPYIIGFDMPLEFYIFGQALMSSHWQPIIGIGNTSVFSSLLSITVLPVIISIESSIDGTLIFKFLFPILYSMVPLILYKVYRQFLGPSAAFLSAFIFMIDPTFYTEMLQLGRQMIAEIFLALLLLIAISKRKQSKTYSGALLTLVLSLGIITAHDSIAYVFLLLMLASLLMSTISSRVERLWNSGILLAWLVLMVTWFLLVTGGAAVVDLATNLSGVWIGITNDLLNPASRPAIVQNALFLSASTPGILHVLSRVSQYAAVASIVIGFLVFLSKKRKSVAERQLIPVMIASIGMLFAAVAVPFFGAILNFSRFFHIALIFLSPCFFIGGQSVVSALRRIAPPRIQVRAIDARILLASLMFLYFIFTSGWVWAVTQDPLPTSVALDAQRMKDSTNLSFVLGYYNWYRAPQDVAAAYWLKDYGSPTQPVCASLQGIGGPLVTYGGRDINNPNLAYSFEKGTCEFSQNEYVYFSEFNALYHAYGLETPISISEISTRVTMEDRVYSGVAIVYSS